MKAAFRKEAAFAMFGLKLKQGRIPYLWFYPDEQSEERLRTESAPNPSPLSRRSRLRGGGCTHLT